MKTMRISKTEKVIEIEYTDINKAGKIYEQLPSFEQKRCSISGFDLTYDLTDVEPKYIPYIVKDLFRKSNYNTDIDYGEVIGDTNDKIIFRLNSSSINGNRIFRITPIKADGTKGTLDFGFPYQYTTKCSFIFTREGEFLLNTRNNWYTDKAHTISFDKVDFLIEIGEIQF